EVMVDGRRGGEPDRTSDLPDGRRVSPGAQRGGDVVEDLDLPFGVVPGHWRLLSDAMIQNRRSTSTATPRSIRRPDPRSRRRPDAGAAPGASRRCPWLPRARTRPDP